MVSPSTIAAVKRQLDIEFTCYRDWSKACRCRFGELEMMVVTSIGPRVMSLRHGRGPNLLAADPEDFRVGDWHLYGGHRFTTAPENEQSYLPDNASCDARVQNGGLTLAWDSAAFAIRKSLWIGADARVNGFVLRHQLVNEGKQPWQGAPWAITCVPSNGCVLLPRQAFEGAPVCPPRFWAVDGHEYAGPQSDQWEEHHDYFLIRPNGQRGKLGLYSASAWIAWIGPEIVFAICCPQSAAPQCYPDDGCNLEVYTSRHYLELEHVGPVVTLPPGASVTLEEQWRILPISLTSLGWPEIRTRCFAALNHPQSPAVPI